MKIYLDHSATTPMDKEVMAAMRPYFNRFFGNPASVHSFGRRAADGVEKARAQVADFLNCRPEEIIFTSGATESDNLAIKGLVKALRQKGVKKMHIITSVVEHDAVLEPCLELEKEGVEVTYLPVKPNGTVEIKKLKAAIRDHTVLVSVMYVNSEVGVVMPILEIGRLLRRLNAQRLASGRSRRLGRIYFHTDATQAINFFNCDVERHHIDLLSLSGHKIYGPKGVGALYKRQGVPLAPIQRGGHQENNWRSGTLNVAGIVGLGAAIEQLGGCGLGGRPSAIQRKVNLKITRLRDRLVSGILKNIPDTVLNTDRKNSTPAHAHFSFLGVEGESSLMALDLAGIAVSTGSACASSNLKASHVLLAMGIDKEVAHYSIRITLGKHTTAEEIKKVVKVLPPVIKKLRSMNPLYSGNG